MEPLIGDALGEALLAYIEGDRDVQPVVERDDGFVSPEPASLFFAGPGDWFDVEESALSRVTGRVLDIGAGAGRFAKPLVDSGHEVVALDVSAGCTEVCRRLGIPTTFTGTVFDLAESSSLKFNTFLMMGHNLALLAGPEEAPRFLAALSQLAAPGARIIGTSRRPAATDDPVNLQYQQMNRERGRAPAQLSLRVRYRAVATPWFDYWFMAIDELRDLAAQSGWMLHDVTTDDSHYLAELRLS